MARLVVKLDGFLEMLMGAGKIAELKASAAGNAVRDQGLGTIRPGPGFAQEKLPHFAHRCRFAAAQMPAPKTVIGENCSEASSSRLANSRTGALFTALLSERQRGGFAPR